MRNGGLIACPDNDLVPDLEAKVGGLCWHTRWRRAIPLRSASKSPIRRETTLAAQSSVGRRSARETVVKLFDMLDDARCGAEAQLRRRARRSRASSGARQIDAEHEVSADPQDGDATQREQRARWSANDVLAWMPPLVGGAILRRQCHGEPLSRCADPAGTASRYRRRSWGTLLSLECRPGT